MTSASVLTIHRARSAPGALRRVANSVRSTGTGRVRSFVTFRHPFVPTLSENLPYTVVKIALDDYPDVVMHGHFLGSRPATTGMPVRISWSPISGTTTVLPNWEPIDD